MLGGPDPYDQLPESIKAAYTRKEYLWLSDAEKAALVSNSTRPDDDAEDPPA